MFARLVKESFSRNARRKVLTAAALVVGMAVATATLTIALEVGDRLAHEFRSFGANLLVTPQADTLPVEIGGVDYRAVNEGAYLNEADLGKLKTIFWRHNIEGFTPFLDVPAFVPQAGGAATLVGTWYEHDVPVPDGTLFKTGLSITHPWWKIDGRWFHDGAEECVVGAAFAAQHPEIKIGSTLNVAAGEHSTAVRPLAVAGIVSTGDAEDNSILVPLSIAQAISGHAGQIRSLFVSALTKPADALAERGEMAQNDKNIQLTPTEYDKWFCSPYISSISFQIKTVLPGTEVHAIRRVAETEGRVLSRVSTLLWIVTLAALIAAALAVAATSATTVIERRSEIGVMKALGASNVMVTGLFLIEQLMLAIFGGAIGFAFGAGLARILGTSVFGAPATPQFILVPVVLGLAAIVALVGSLIPLRRAAHLRPALILRGQ
ncbi:MAG TPA: ABC transporter permease [Candidatus Acidoferrales bacterium]